MAKLSNIATTVLRWFWRKPVILSMLLLTAALSILLLGQGLRLFQWQPLAHWYWRVAIVAALFSVFYGVRLSRWLWHWFQRQVPAQQTDQQQWLTLWRQWHRQWRQLQHYCRRHQQPQLNWRYQRSCFLFLGGDSLTQQSLLSLSGQTWQHDQGSSSLGFHWSVNQEMQCLLLTQSALTSLSQPQATLWRHWLKQLKKWRPQQPLQAAVLVISLTDCLKHESLQYHLAERIALLKEAYRHLGIHFPVYWLIEGVEQLAGYDAFVHSLPEHGHLLGYGLEGLDNAEAMATAFDRYIAQLGQQSLAALPLGRSSQHHRASYYFPMQMAEMRACITKLLTAMLAAGIQQKGCFWVSLKPSLPESLDCIRQKTITTVALGHDRSTSRVKHFFSQALWAQNQCTGINTTLVQRRRRYRRGLNLAVCTLTALFCLMWGNQFIHHEQQLRKMVLLTQSSVETPSLPNRLALLRQLAQQAQQFQLAPWGLVSWHSPIIPIQQIYRQALQVQWLPQWRLQFQQHLQQQLQRVQKQQHPSALAHYELDQALHFYLVLGHPQHNQANAMYRYWQQQVAPNASVQQRYYSADLLRLGYPAQVLSQPLIQQVRRYLPRASIAANAYWLWKQDWTSTAFIIADADYLANASVLVLPHDQVKIPAAYTRQGYQRDYRFERLPFLHKALQQQTTLNASNAKRTLPLKQMDWYYWQDYLQVWCSAITRIKVAPFHSLSQAMASLAVFASAQSPILTLLQRIKNNTSQLPPLGQSIVATHFQALNVMTQKHGKAAPIARMQKAIGLLQTQLSQIMSSSNPHLAAFHAAQQWFLGKPDAAVEAMRQQIAVLPSPLKNWMQTLLRQTEDIIFKQANHYVATQWQARLGDFYQHAFAERYPFHRHSQITANLVDLRNFFQPGGRVDQFVKHYLSDFLHQNRQGHWVWTTAAGLQFNVNPQVPAALTRVATLQAMLFAASKGAPIRLQLQPVSIGQHTSSIRFQYNGKRYDYAGGSGQAFWLTWPPHKDQQVVLRLDPGWWGASTQVEYRGIWGLWHLLDLAVVKQAKDSQQTLLCWYQDKQSVCYQAQGASASVSFKPDRFQHLQFPIHYPMSAKEGQRET